jgi:hypothetical protein
VTESLVSDRAEEPPVEHPPRRALSVGRLLVAGWAAQVCVRLLLAWGRDVPLIYPDEAGYLIAARGLTGGPGADLSGHSFYQGGYPLLIAVARLAGDDQGAVYRAVVGINAAVGALVFPLGYLVLLRFGLRRRQAVAVAWAAALLPAATLYGGQAMTDAVLPAVVLGWLVALDAFLRRGGQAPAVYASLAAAYAYATHLRGTVVLAVHVVVLAFVLVIGTARGPARRAVAIGLGVGATVSGAAALLNAWLSRTLYPAGPRDHGGILADRLTSLDGQVRAITGAAGQLWTLMAGTWGLGALGIATVLIVLLRRATPVHDRIMAGALLATTVGIGYASSAALQDEQRVSNFAYARYASCVALAWALVGLGVLVRRLGPPRRMPFALLLLWATGLWLVLYLGDRLHTYQVNPWDFPDTAFLGGSYDELRPVAISAVACALLAVLWGLSRWGVVKLTVGLAGINLFLTWLPATGWASLEARSPDPPLPVTSGGVVIERPVPGVDHPPIDLARPYPELVYARVAYKTWWTRPERFDPERGLPRPGVCAAVVDWPAGVLAADTWPEHPAGWRYQRAGSLGLLWWVAWYDPSCPVT